MPVESEFDFCARRAAEEFVAANRASCAEARRNHRHLAQHYADLVRALISAGAGTGTEGDENAAEAA
jgi:hypothetical protein